MKAKLPIRTQDKHGAGHYGAPRGNRKHNGVDFSCYPGTQILSITSGIVTKLGYPYKDDLDFRYIQVSDEEGNDWRYFYVEPLVNMEEEVTQGQVIGELQDLDKRYPGITNHCHLEIKQGNNYIDPSNII